MEEKVNFNIMSSIPSIGSVVAVSAGMSPISSQASAVGSKSWHSPHHQAERLEMKTSIMEYLRSCRPNASSSWLTGVLPNIAERNENELYNRADTFEEYFDRNTLPARLSGLAHNFGNGPGIQSGQSTSRIYFGAAAERRDTIDPYLQQRHASQMSPPDTTRTQAAQLTSPQEHYANRKSLSSIGTSAPQQQPTRAQPAATTTQPSTTSPKREDEELIRKQQQLILLLRHAQYCSEKGEHCSKVRHCWAMKQVRNHLAVCNDSHCSKDHCASSKYLLAHSSSCREATCPVCAPIAGTIKRMELESSKPQVPAAANNNSAIQVGESSVNEGPKYPLDSISCAMYTFSQDQVNMHYKTIHAAAATSVESFQAKAEVFIAEILKYPVGRAVFGKPVDPEAMQIPDYFDVIKSPMDLGTVKSKLSKGLYCDVYDLVADVHLTFDNAMKYNPPSNEIHLLAKAHKKNFVSLFDSYLKGITENAEHCRVCGNGELAMVLPTYYCSGSSCQKRIREGRNFYQNAAGQWCEACYKEKELELPQMTHRPETELWVECESCHRWVHQICSLFNSRRNVGDSVSFVCPTCLCAKRKSNPNMQLIRPTTKKMRASELPVTALSEFLEKRILKRLDIAYRQTATRLGVDPDKVEKCPPLVLRQVSCLDKLHSVQEGVYSQCKDKNQEYPKDFPVRTKCLLLFQTIDGQDVILFGMYVYEYGLKCPQPNQGRVYISYLDSVNYLRPKQYRTTVYHEVLISYLDYVRARGFHTAHIWSCPPQEGDDYIMYVHPQHQKTPEPKKLREWYAAMLKQCVDRGIVCEITDFYKEFLNKDHESDIASLPYFEGDYWVNEAEDIIRKARKNTGKNSPLKPQRDPVMTKLASSIERMKGDFFVARLHPKGFIPGGKMDESSMEVGDDTAVRDFGQDSSRMDIAEEASQDTIIPAGQDIPPNIRGDTEDVDDIQECEHLDCRQSFLNLCQGNNYQFDQLRRAKHSSMMVLYHLHNPDAPKFAPNCSQCSSDILVGHRKHCATCQIDFCQDCYQQNQDSNSPHMHELSTIAIAEESVQALTDEQRKSRKRSLELHLLLLVHIASCTNCACASPLCPRMKDYVDHERICKSHVKGGCPLCVKVSRLLGIHARSCRDDNCWVSRCSDTKSQNRSLQLRQQQMDDRRRQNINKVYGGNAY